MSIDFDPTGAARRQADAAPRPRMRILASLGLLLVAVTAAHCAQARAAEDPANRAQTSRAVRDEAARLIPLDKLSGDDRAKVTAVLNSVSVFRRMPVASIDCEPELFHYLVKNPEVVTSIWQLMGVSKVTLDRTDDTHFRCVDGEGTTARAEYVFQNHDTYILYADGVYEGPLFPRPIRGQCVTVLKTAGIRETDGRYYITVRMDMFLHVDNAGVELIAKMFQGWMGRSIDYNFSETFSFLGSISHTAETNPSGMRKLIGRLKLDSDRRVEFAQMADHVAAKMAGLELVDAAAAARH